MSCTEQNVVRLDVPVDHATAVGVVEGIGHLGPDLRDIGRRKAPLAVQTVSQRFAVDVRHHVVQQPFRLTRVVKGQDVRVGESCGDLDLS